MDRSQLLPLARRAIEAGAAQTAISSFLWDVSGRCQRPRRVTLTGRQLLRPRSALRRTRAGKIYRKLGAEYDRVVNTDLTNAPLWLDMDVPCRQCEPCLAHRRRVWQSRILTEILASRRTWFGTLTLSPEEHYLSECRVGSTFSVLSEHEKLLALHKANSDLLTRYWKRVRKASVGRLRLCLVMEPHKSGLPHYHALVHETHEGRTTKATLKEQWPHGFSRWKLVDDPRKGSWYVAKYLTKTIGARVRASKSYGDVHTALAVEDPIGASFLNKKPPQKGLETMPQSERTE